MMCVDLVTAALLTLRIKSYPFMCTLVALHAEFYKAKSLCLDIQRDGMM